MAKELSLKYGCNPNQKPARIFMQEGELPIEVLNGRPGYINFMDDNSLIHRKGKTYQTEFKSRSLLCSRSGQRYFNRKNRNTY